MNRPTQPTLPRSVESNLSTETPEEIAKRDIGTLEDLRGWIDALIAQKRRLLADDAPDVVIEGTTGKKLLTAVPPDERSDVPVKDLMGSFVWQFITCENDRCNCTTGRPADLHGPYLRRQYLDGSGHHTTEYIPESDRRQGLVTRIATKPSVEDIEQAVES